MEGRRVTGFRVRHHKKETCESNRVSWSWDEGRVRKAQWLRRSLREWEEKTMRDYEVLVY
jgi:hypothetical protein